MTAVSIGYARDALTRSGTVGVALMGREFRVALDFGAGATDHRGAYRNAGARWQRFRKLKNGANA